MTPQEYSRCDRPVSEGRGYFARFFGFLAGLCGSVCAGLAFASRSNTDSNGIASSSYSAKSTGFDFFVFMVV